jgi:hypothetical protein
VRYLSAEYLTPLTPNASLPLLSLLRANRLTETFESSQSLSPFPFLVPFLSPSHPFFIDLDLLFLPSFSLLHLLTVPPSSPPCR